MPCPGELCTWPRTPWCATENAALALGLMPCDLRLARGKNRGHGLPSEAFVICKAGRPLVQVTRLVDAADASPPPRRRLGLLAGQCSVPDDFDRIAAEEIADLFEGQSPVPSAIGEQ